MDTIERIKQQISQNDVILYMKGTPLFPQCGFSGQVVHILRECGITYHYINILENPDGLSQKKTAGICQECRSSINKNDKFCSNCGYNIFSCSKCGSIITQTDKFCSNCGDSLKN